ncbi:MAG: ATP-dependent DNA helicase [Planctomycetota bacterium]|nr:ATP-dependent DNA helicase [Planctomycetota bacterium]
MISNSSTADDAERLLAEDGPVARAFATRDRAPGGFEARPQQLDMARRVGEALSSGRHALLEAGTGVGKSFAYLVPALCWAVENDACVAVATSTIALQEQIVRRDLPLLAEALPFEFTYALVKGRGNYLCFRRMYRALEGGGSLFDDEAREQLEAIRTWSVTTEEGSRQDLGFQPLPSVWESVQAEQGNCLGRACRYYEPCHYQASRRRAQGAQLLVLNHHVLMADLAMRRTGGGFLPELDAIVVDEAHDLEDTAAEHLGLRVSGIGVQVQLGRLWSPRRRRGLLAGHPDSRLRLAVDAARGAARVFFEETRALLGSERGQTVALPDGAHLPDELSPRLAELASVLLKAARGADAETSLEIGSRARGIRGLADALAALARDELEDQVRWGEVSGRGGLALYSAPIEVGPLLDQVLFDAHHAVILTSATLAAGRPASFDFIRGRLGLGEADEAAIGSPFDYPRQARLVVHTELPDPSRESSSYEAELPEAVLDAVRRSRGGAFVLFTSYTAMRRTADALRHELEALGLRVLVQGESLERPQLLDAFREGDGVLFGVASFWQGVDVPGEALRHVVITRLPFEVPTHPLQVARSRRLEEKGGDSFRDLSLPTAALRLKQGFGRLIRHTSDRGLVTILDKRIVTKGYGRYLLESLPECPIERIPADEFI